MTSVIDITQADVFHAAMDARRRGERGTRVLMCRTPGTFVSESVLAYAEKFGVERVIGPGLVPPYRDWDADTKNN